ncbi:MAG: peptidoglycan-binding domain-containing protein [Patescibacteria group bacterium]
MTRKILGVVTVLSLVLGIAVLVANADHDPFDGDEQEKVDICHLEGNDTYNPAPDVSINAVLDETGHGGHEGDIIPPFHYEEDGSYPGQNWDDEGQAIWENDCEILDGDGEGTGSITIVKVYEGDLEQSFEFTGNFDTFTLEDGEDEVIDDDLAADEYTISETMLLGWNEPEIECTGTALENVSVDGWSVTIDLGEDENVTCTFTNNEEVGEETGSITIIKVVEDDEVELWSFDFSGDLGEFSLDNDDPSMTEDELESDEYTVTEGELPDNWQFGGIECEGTDPENISVEGQSVTIELEEGEDVTCTFTNSFEEEEEEDTAKIMVVKNTTDGNGTFAFTGTGVEPGLELTTIDNTASSSFFDVFADVNGETYDVVETQQENWTLVSISCVYDNHSVGVEIENGEEVTVFPGDEVTCTFTNDFTPPHTPTPQCSDNTDNSDEEDSLADENDPGCHTDGNAGNSGSYDPNDNNETDEPSQPSNPPQCSDGNDNEGDSEIDEADPGCHTDEDANNPDSYDPSDDDETDSGDIPQGGGGGDDNDNAAAPQVLGAATDICNWTSTYMRRNWRGNVPADVMKVQNDLLNAHQGNTLVVDGIYGPLTEAAVNAFQARYAAEILAPWNISSPTGIFYLSSLHQAQKLLCPTVEDSLPPLINWSQNPVVAR